MAKDAGAELGWLGRRWLSHMFDELSLAPTEAQLKAAARASVGLRVEKGRIEAAVAAAGNAVATLKLKPLSDREWRQVLEGLSANRAAALQVLTGQFGPELEAAFAAAGADLFPPLGASLAALRCSCREGFGCRHELALVLTATAHLDANPYLWLEVLGRTRAAVQAVLQVSPEAAPELSLQGFWATEADPAEVQVAGADGNFGSPDALLRRLGPLPLPREMTWVDMEVERPGGRGPARVARPLEDVLREWVFFIGESARATAQGELPPQFRPEPLPGKPLPPGPRLATEAEEAVRREGRWLSADELAELCPTAAAMGEPLNRGAVTEALAEVSDDVLTVGGRYACTRLAALSGAVFRHVVTYDEQRRRTLSADADWRRAVALISTQPGVSVGAGPVRAPEEPALFDALALRVGDELWLTVTDPGRPVLEADVIRREERTLHVDPAGKAAVQMLLRHLTAAGRYGMAELEAVGVLLAEGYYHRREGQDPVWLLPLLYQGVSLAAKGRFFTAGQEPWVPAFAVRQWGQWPEKENALRWLTVDMANAGASRREVEAALTVARWWSDLWSNPQDRLEMVPPLGRLLDFLWVTAPRLAQPRGVAPEAVPGALGAWFRLLERRYPAVELGYARHLAVCDDVGAYAHRLSTYQAATTDEDRVVWLAEGYRWIGEERTWPAT